MYTVYCSKKELLPWIKKSMYDIKNNYINIDYEVLNENIDQLKLSYYEPGFDYFPVCTEPDTIYVYSTNEPGSIVGSGGIGYGLTVKILDSEIPYIVDYGIYDEIKYETIKLRILHEMLHCLGLDADGMEENYKDFVPVFYWPAFWLTSGIFRNIWQSLYYSYLIKTNNIN